MQGAFEAHSDDRCQLQSASVLFSLDIFVKTLLHLNTPCESLLFHLFKDTLGEKVLVVQTLYKWSWCSSAVKMLQQRCESMRKCMACYDMWKYRLKDGWGDATHKLAAVIRLAVIEHQSLLVWGKLLGSKKEEGFFFLISSSQWNLQLLEKLKRNL